MLWRITEGFRFRVRERDRVRLCSTQVILDGVMNGVDARQGNPQEACFQFFLFLWLILLLSRLSGFLSFSPPKLLGLLTTAYPPGFFQATQTIGMLSVSTQSSSPHLFPGPVCTYSVSKLFPNSSTSKRLLSSTVQSMCRSPFSLLPLTQVRNFRVLTKHTKGQTLCDYTHVRPPEQASSWRQEEKWWLPGLRGGVGGWGVRVYWGQCFLFGKMKDLAVATRHWDSNECH